MSRIQTLVDIERPGNAGYRGRAFLYVLPTSGAEDILKVGLTHDPLKRWSSFHPRWFHIFDLDHGLLVETETRADAQALETSLHRTLSAHQCPVPLTILAGAGGQTEWYRGAYEAARSFVFECLDRGYVVHPEARSWLRPAMSDALARLDGIVRHAFECHCAAMLTPTRLDIVRALVDSHREFGADIENMFPAWIRHELRLDAS